LLEAQLQASPPALKLLSETNADQPVEKYAYSSFGQRITGNDLNLYVLPTGHHMENEYN